MKTSRLFISTIVVALLSSLALVGCKGHNSRGAFAVDYVTEVLDLSESQELELEKIREEILLEIKEHKSEDNPIRTLLREQLVSDKMDKEQLQQVVSMHRQQTDEIIDLTIDRLIAFHSTLSIEQKEKLVNKLEKLSKMHRGHFRR